MNQDRSKEFAEAAAQYCFWCENPKDSEREDARAALRHLSRLYVLAQDLRVLDDVTEVESVRISDVEWRSAYERFASLPVGYYTCVLDPLSDLTGDPEIGCGDLSDDLADIYRDLSAGLAHFRRGLVDAAEWEWAWSFRNHWGCHASAAIQVLHCWFADEAAW